MILLNHAGSGCSGSSVVAESPSAECTFSVARLLPDRDRLQGPTAEAGPETTVTGIWIAPMSVRYIASVEHQVRTGHGMKFPARKHPSAHDGCEHSRGRLSSPHELLTRLTMS